MERRVCLKAVYPYPPERVWKALTSRKALAKWLLPNDFVPRLGHKFRFTKRRASGKEEQIRCEVVALEAPNRLAFTWQPDNEEPPSLVTWTLEPCGEGTRV